MGVCGCMCVGVISCVSRYKGASKHIANRFMHLTNYSINKKNVQFTANSDETVCQGHKWYAINALLIRGGWPEF